MVEEKLVIRGEPFQYAVEEAEKFKPFNVSVNWVAPDVVEIGSIELRTGVELRTVNVWLFEVPPPGAGLVTVTGYVPAVVMSEALIWAVT